eukprot:gene10980-11135_t
MEQLQTIHYVTQDPMQNLKLRVTLTRLSAARTKLQDARDKEETQQQDDHAGMTDVGAAEMTTNASTAISAVRPKPLTVVRTFSWQEKVYSKAELVAAKAHLQTNGQQVHQFASPKRTAHFGSQSHIGTDLLLTAPPEGSLLFSYVQTDEFCERFETARAVTTSSWEHENHLTAKLISNRRNRQKMLKFHAMFIMADLGDEHTVAGSSEKVLCVLRAHHDGSFDMTPGFSTAKQKYRFEDDHGGMYEYVIEPASRNAAPSLEKRTAKLAVAVAAQAEEVRRHHHQMEHMGPPGPDANAVRLVLLAELVSAAGFTRDRLYIEWQLHFNPDLWVLQYSEQDVPQPGLIQGVTHVSRMVQYPADPSTDTPPLWVAHFAHPIEAEWIARSTRCPKDWPRLLLQVKTYDLWDRSTTEGYGWLQLDCSTSGSGIRYVDTWRPLGTRRDQQAAFFIGGSEELADLSYVALPQGHKGRVLNKYGYKTETSGSVKVRIHSIIQAGADGGTSPRKTAANRGQAAAAARQRRELSLAVVLERARSRLQEARGGEVMGPGPLRYQWFKDNKRLTVATSNSPLLVLVDLGAHDSGSYHCQVANKDGAAVSNRALLTVKRVGRVQQALAGGSPPPADNGDTDSAASRATAPQVHPSLPNTFSKRSTVPRSLAARTGSSLPYSMRLAGRPAEGGGGVNASPVQGSSLPLVPASLAAGRTNLNQDARSTTAAAVGAVIGGSTVELGSGRSSMQSRMIRGPKPAGGISNPVRQLTTQAEQSSLSEHGAVLQPEQLEQQLPPSAFAHATMTTAQQQGSTAAAVSGYRPSSADSTPPVAAGDRMEGQAGTNSDAAQLDDTRALRSADGAGASPVRTRTRRERVPEQ